MLSEFVGEAIAVLSIWLITQAAPHLWRISSRLLLLSSCWKEIADLAKESSTRKKTLLVKSVTTPSRSVWSNGVRVSLAGLTAEMYWKKTHGKNLDFPFNPVAIQAERCVWFVFKWLLWFYYSLNNIQSFQFASIRQGGQPKLWWLAELDLIKVWSLWNNQFNFDK